MIPRDEAAPYYFNYIDKVPAGDIVPIFSEQLQSSTAFLRSISEHKSLHRYAPGKWTIREVLSHLNDAERLFASRAFWFARGFDSPLPSFDQEVCIANACANQRSWASHVDEFESIRRGTISLFQHLPKDAWMRRGIASDNPFTVRALAYCIAGHLIHHENILRERYLAS